MKYTSINESIIRSDNVFRWITFERKNDSVDIFAIAYDPEIKTTKQIQLLAQLEGLHMIVNQSQLLSGLLKFDKI